MQRISPQSPEAREERERREHVHIQTRTIEIAKRIFFGVYSDGFIHAGNLAYLTMLTLFPALIVVAALAQLAGRSADAQLAVASLFITLPTNVQQVVAGPIRDVLQARTGNLLWLGGAVGIWTVTSYIETIRDILRRAYGTQRSNPFWHYRLFSIVMTVGAVILVMTAFSAQVMLVAAEEFVIHAIPRAQNAAEWIAGKKIIPILVLFVALYLLFWSLMPNKYRFSDCPKWPGALFVALWWQAMLAIIPWFYVGLSNYSLTYGGLAGVIITMIFFWFIGFGIVIGAHLNAALAEPHVSALQAEAEPQVEA